jgi:predicted nucleotidyltransferase
MKNVDPKAAREFLERKEAGTFAANRRLFARATRESESIIRMIIDKYAPSRVYQWGSLLEPERFTGISDIDIAVEGIETAEEFFSLYRDAELMASFSLDIVQMEKIAPEFADIIRMKGKLVHERE